MRRRRAPVLAGAAAVLATTGALVVAGTGVLGEGAPATSVSRPTAGATAAAPPLHVVALGDSVPAGTGCGCTAFPVLYGRLLAQSTGRTTNVQNDGTGGLDTQGLLDDLSGSKLETSVGAADVVLVTIGANDFLDHESDVTDASCTDGDHDCVSDDLATMRTNLRAILARIRTLRSGAPTTVLVTGYWNVFEDGDVGRSDYGSAGLKASVALTERVDDAIRTDATSAGATYVDLFTPFQSSAAINDLLADDGDHPSASGHALIARTLAAEGLVPTT